MDCSPPGSSVHGDSPGKNTGVGCHSLLQGIFPIQGSNPGLLHWQAYSLPLSHQGSLLLTSTPVILQPIPKILFNLNYLHENPIPQYSHLLGIGGLKLQQMNFRGTQAFHPQQPKNVYFLNVMNYYLLVKEMCICLLDLIADCLI